MTKRLSRDAHRVSFPLYPASCMSRPQLLPESPSELEIARFLRRFSELIATGQSAGYLREAAGLIEQQADRISQTEDQLQQQTREAEQSRAATREAEAQAQSLRDDAAPQQRAVAALQDRLASAETEFAAERERLLERIVRAEGRVAEADRELRRLRGQLAPLGRSHAVVAVETLRLLRGQFDALAQDLQRGGDLVSGAMCQVGICAIDQTLAARSAPRAAAVRESA